MSLRLWPLVVALFCMAWLSSGHSDAGDAHQMPVSGTAPLLAAQMVTSVEQGVGRAWLCGIDDTAMAAYLFLPPGHINGLNPAHWFGIEIDHNKASMADQMRYLWSVNGEDSLSMNTLDGSDPVVWSNIVFIDSNQIHVQSSVTGHLDCYRGTGEWEVSTP